MITLREHFIQGIRQIGNKVTLADCFEPDLNEVIPGDVRDTQVQQKHLQAFTVRDAHQTDKRKIPTDWMHGKTTGDKLIHAVVPKDWEVDDKSGVGSYGAPNDIAIVWPPNREPLIIAILSSQDREDAIYDTELIAQTAKVTIDALK